MGHFGDVGDRRLLHKILHRVEGIGGEVVRGVFTCTLRRPASSSAVRAVVSVARFGVERAVPDAASNRVAGNVVIPANRTPGIRSIRSAAFTTSAASNPPS